MTAALRRKTAVIIIIKSKRLELVDNLHHLFTQTDGVTL